MSNAIKDIIHDQDRLQEIADLDLFSDDVKQMLDELVKLTAEHLNLPYGTISIVLDEAQFFVSQHGPKSELGEVGGTPLEWSFCKYVVQDRADFVVSNALESDRMKDSPLVTVEGLRCYAGTPMITSKGYIIGSFCASGNEVREFGAHDIAYLRQMAVEATRRIEARAGR